VYQGKLRESIPAFLTARRLDPGDRSADDTLMRALLSLLQDEAGGPQAYPELGAARARPLVSVIIPTRDRLLLLRDALESVAGQSYGEWEAIVVNDGGPDVAGVVRSLPRQAASRVAVLESASSQGAAHARNLAIARAQGETLAFLDDDDIFLPDHLETLVAEMAASGAPVAYTESVAVEERIVDGRRVELRRGDARPYRYARAILQVRNVIPTANWGMRRECFARWGGFDDALPCAEDWELLLRFSEQTPFRRIARTTAEIHVRADAVDSITKRVPLRPTCELLYRRYPAQGSELVAIGREVFSSSVV
jgi:glycosyltransferase involved in cell wall biosynthesis